MGKSEDNDKKVTLFVSIQKILIKPQNNDFPQTLRFWECVKIAACFRYWFKFETLIWNPHPSCTTRISNMILECRTMWKQIPLYVLLK